MRIERLRIENFRRFQEVDLEFPDGVLALVGRNGAGKSSLLEAVGWCLYGNEAARTGKDLIRRRGAAIGDDVRVHLAFRLGAHTYEITRELLGKSGSHVATVLVDGKVAVQAGAQSHRECSEYVARLFHMDRDAFFTSLVARQRELAALTDAAPSQRKRLLIGLLRLDAVDGAIQTARARKRDAKAELSGLRSAMQDPAPMQKRLDELATALEQDALRLSESDHAIQQLVEQVEDLRVRRESSRKAAEAHNVVLGELSTADQSLKHVLRERAGREVELQQCAKAASEAAALAPRLEQLAEAKQRVDRLAALRVQHDELVRLRKEMRQTEQDLARSHEEVEAASAALAAAGAVRSLNERVARERPRREEALQQWQAQSSEAAARLQETQRQVRELEQKVARIQDMGPESPCPTCTRPLREHHDELLHGFAAEVARLRVASEETQAKLGEARRQEAAARQSVAELAEREQELREKLANLAREEARHASAQARIQDTQARLQRLRDQEAALGQETFDPKEFDAARKLLAELETLRERHARLCTQAERASDVRRILEELAETEREALAAREAAEKKRAQLGFDPAAHEMLEKQAEQAERRLGDARVARERLQGERQRRVDERERLQESLRRQEELQAKAAGIEQRLRTLEQLAGDRDHGLLPEFKDHLIGRIRPLLSLHAGRLFRELTEGRYSDLEVDENYDLRVHEEGESYALERFSGGEGDLANLCLRLAVSQVVAERAGTEGFGFLALDEVFGSQDEIRKGNILRSLQALASRFRQILVITHVNDVKDSVDHILRVEALEDGTSRVVFEG